MDNKKITITIPSLPISDIAADMLNGYATFKQKIRNVLVLFYETGTEMAYRTKRGFFHSIKTALGMGNRFNNKKRSKKLLMLFIPLFIVVILVIGAIQALRQTGQTNATVLSSSVSKNATLKTTELNKDFSFPLDDEKGKEIGRFSYTLQSAEITNEIIVKGQRATAAPGRVFLIINLQLKNTLKQGLQINSRDYVRLSVNGNTEDLLAPEIHNDPVEVQAISTKFTRLGFALDKNAKDLVLIVGEIDGDKQEIPLKF
jgi:hypothetical protein